MIYDLNKFTNYNFFNILNLSPYSMNGGGILSIRTSEIVFSLTKEMREGDDDRLTME